MNQPIIVWFRRDLRLEDNPALQAAIETGRKGGQATVEFILQSRCFQLRGESESAMPSRDIEIVRSPALWGNQSPPNRDPDVADTQK